MKHYIKLYIKSLAEELTEVEKTVLSKRLNESEQNKIESVQLEKIWRQSAVSKGLPAFDAELDWKIIQAKINSEESSKRKQKYFIWGFFFRFKPDLIQYWKPAFGISILLIVAALFFFMSKNDSGLLITKVSTMGTEKKLFVLPDYSKVYLNKNSSVEFQKSFGESERKVKLNGEAYFDVKKDSNPFIIETGNAIITVTGTEFVITSLNNITKVFVKSGRVNLAPTNSSENVLELNPGQLSFVKGKNKPDIPIAADADEVLNWMTNEFTFISKPLSEIVEELNAYYDIDIKLDEKLIDEKLTGTFNSDVPDSIVSMICLTLGVNYEKQSGRYIIKPRSK